jgi:Protein of unknown function (DUF3467)
MSTMTEIDSQGFPSRMRLATTPDLEAGVYADFVSVWHQPASFVLDFSVNTAPPQLMEDERGEKFIARPARVVSRVRIPPSQVFEIMKALENQLSAWEREHGARPTEADA